MHKRLVRNSVLHKLGNACALANETLCSLFVCITFFPSLFPPLSLLLPVSLSLSLPVSLSSSVCLFSSVSLYLCPPPSLSFVSSSVRFALTKKNFCRLVHSLNKRTQAFLITFTVCPHTTPAQICKQITEKSYSNT